MKDDFDDKLKKLFKEGYGDELAKPPSGKMEAWLPSVNGEPYIGTDRTPIILERPVTRWQRFTFWWRELWQ